MKHWKRMLALFAAVGISVLGLFGAGVPTFAESAANTYYISSSTGDDRADGRTPETAWKTFQNVNAKKLSAGERVLLKRGDEFHERLEILGQGTENAWIEISAYGEGEKPVIRLNNDEDDIGILVKDFYRGSDGKAVVSPIQYIKINNIKVADSRLGIFVRIYMTENIGKTSPELASHHVEITDCEFENMNSNVLPELNAAVDAAEAEWEEYSPIASAAIYKVYNEKMTELHGGAKGDLPKVSTTGMYEATGGGGYEYVFPTAVMLGGIKSTIDDSNADKASPAFKYFRVQRVEIRDCIAGIMAWFYNWNGQTAKDKFRSNVQYVNIEDVVATGVSPSAIGLEGCEGGATLSGQSLVPSPEGWGRIKNVRVVRGAESSEYGIPLGTTDVIIEKTKNFLIEECEFLGMTNHNNCDGVGFDFEGNCANIELKNSVFAYNDGGAMLIMDNGSGGHSNLFIRDNLFYGNLENAYHQYNNRNNNIDSHVISFHNRNNDNVIIENNTVRHRRYTTMGVEVGFVGEAEELPETYTLKNNDVGCYESGAGFKEFSVWFETQTAEGGKITLENIGLHSKRYGAMKLTVRGSTALKGTIRATSTGGSSSSEPIAFETADGIVDIAALPGINWNIPFNRVEIVLDGVSAGRAATVEFLPNTGAEFAAFGDEGNKVLVTLTGDAGAVFRTGLEASDFALCNLLSRKKILSVERLDFSRAVLTLDGALTETEKGYLELDRFATILPSAYEANSGYAFAAMNVNGTRNENSFFFSQTMDLTARPTKTEYQKGEAFDLSGASATVTTADGETKTVSGSALTVSGYDPEKVGKQTVAICHGNAVAYVNVQVTEGAKGTSDNCGGCNRASAAALLSVLVVAAGIGAFRR